MLSRAVAVLGVGLCQLRVQHACSVGEFEICDMRAGLFQGATHGAEKIRRIGARLAYFLQDAPHNARKLLVRDPFKVWDAGAEGVANFLQGARGWVVARKQFVQSAQPGGGFSMVFIRAV